MAFGSASQLTSNSARNIIPVLNSVWSERTIMQIFRSIFLTSFCAALFLSISGCGNGGGTSISRKEFDTLRNRVATLEKSMRDEMLIPGVFYEVVKVMDGDTFMITGNRKVRLHGVDTPESVHSQKGLQWYGKESSEFLRKLLVGKKVRLQPEKGASFQTGAYGRFLAFVYREDGLFVNAEVIRKGAAFSYRKYKCSLRDTFDKLEARAKKKGLGVWDDKARVKWEATHIIPDVPFEKATVIASKASKMLHQFHCGRKPAPENGIYFESADQAAIFRFTKHHSCMKPKPNVEEPVIIDSTDPKEN